MTGAEAAGLIADPAAGYPSFAILGLRPSIYRRAEIYAALIEGQPSDGD